MDTQIPAMAGGSENLSMTRKSYTPQFQREAVDLYESTPGATIGGIADDLGVSRGTLALWIERFGSGTRVESPTPARGRPATRSKGPEASNARIARLEAELRATRVEKAKLEKERDILRAAAKYFAGETDW